MERQCCFEIIELLDDANKRGWIKYRFNLVNKTEHIEIKHVLTIYMFINHDQLQKEQTAGLVKF